MWYQSDAVLLYQTVIDFQRPIKYLNVTEDGGESTFNDFFRLIKDSLRRREPLHAIYLKYPSLDSLDDLVMIVISLVLGDPLDQSGWTTDIIERLLKSRDPNDQTLLSINRFRQKEGLTPYSSLNSLSQTYEQWRSQYLTSKNQDLQDAKILLPLTDESLISTMSTFEPLPSSPLTITQVTFVGHPKIKTGRTTGLVSSITRELSEITEDDGILLFNESRLSRYVPYIQYNGGEPGSGEDITASGSRSGRKGIQSTSEGDPKTKKLFKVFEGESLILGGETTGKSKRSRNGHQLNYSNLIPSLERTTQPNTIYLSVWTGEGNLVDITMESLILVKFDLGTNTIEANIPTKDPGLSIRDRQIVIDRIESALPIDIGKTNDIKISGFFNIYQATFDYPTLLYAMLLSSPDTLPDTLPLAQFLYMDESRTPYSRKKKFNLNFTNLPRRFIRNKTAPYLIRFLPDILSMTADFMSESKQVDIERNGQVVKLNMDLNTPYLKIHITRTRSKVTGYQLINYLSRLWVPYQQIIPSIRQYYDGIIDNPYTRLSMEVLYPKPAGIVQPTGGRSVTLSRTAATKSRWQLLHEQAPDIFVKGYPRVGCQPPTRQPLLIREDEVDTWKQKKIVVGNTLLERQVLPYPKGEPQIIFVCPDDKFPFPGVKENKVLPNRDRYPFIPCCYKRNQTEPGTRTGYNRYYRGAKPVTTARSSHEYKTDKLLPPQRTGKLPIVIQNLLSIHKPAEYKRFGVVRSTNSLIHCCLTALIDAGQSPPAGVSLARWTSYLKMDTDTQEMMAIDIRRLLAEVNYPELLKQELYDFNLPKITEYLRDSSRFLDPKVFYRALEEFFNINLFVFSFESTGRETISFMDMPRSKNFSIRVGNPRSAIVILKHIGSESNNLTYPQCELIIDKQDRQFKGVFDVSMTRLLYKTYLSTLETLSWRPINSDLVVRAQFYHSMDYQQLFSTSSKAQFIDEYGKMRGLIISPNQVEIIIFFPPAQPLNLPSISFNKTSHHRGNPSVTQLPPLPHVLSVIQAFDHNIPTSVTRKNNLITGIWYQIHDIDHGIYCPFQPIDRMPPGIAEVEKLPEGPENPYLSTGPNQIFRIKNLRRTLKIILQLVQWAFLSSKLPVNVFIDNYLLSGNVDPSIDSNKIYNWSQLSFKLPTVNNIGEVINYLSAVFPSLITDNKIFLYSPTFYRGIAFFLRESQRIFKGLTLKPPAVIDGVFEEAGDFTPQPNVVIFVREDDLLDWLQDKRKSKQQIFKIRTTLDGWGSLASLNEPYMFQAEDGKIYLIQNVIEGNKIQALSVALEWYSHRINLGFRGTTELRLIFRTEPPVHVIYGITESMKPVILVDSSRGEKNYLQLLTYPGSDKYAAMLPVL